MNKKILVTILVMALLVSLFPVSALAVIGNPVTDVTLNRDYEAIIVGDTLDIDATVTPPDADDPTVVWSSDAGGVASVDQTGLVTGISAGKATITATAGGFSDDCVVFVGPNTSGTYDLSIYGNGSTILTADNLTIIFTNTGDVTFVGMQIICGADNTIEIDNVKINNSAAANWCPIEFTDGFNFLNPLNSSSLTAGSNQPAVKVPHPASLTIDGTGSITATGGTNGAGIGGTGSMTVGMIIVYKAGTITAQGGHNAAGIGGGASAEIAEIIINDGYVIAKGGTGAAGIGGSAGSGVSIISIKGGTVEAYGGDGGAGIGGGIQGTCANINISGGTVFAKRGSLSQTDDIGDGMLSSGAVLTINTDDGYPAVFAANDDFCTVSTGTHTYASSMPISGGKLLGITMPATWTAAGAYIIPISVGYNPNGGIGPTALATQHIGTSGTILDGSHLSHATKTFDKWNTQSDGLGTDYAPGSAHVYNTTFGLFAIYKIPVTGVDVVPDTATIIVGDSPTLNVTVTPGDATYNTVAWESSDEAIATVSQSGAVTGVAAGTATITATADGVSDTCAVTVIAEGADDTVLQGAIYDPGNNPLVGWSVVLESTPVTVVTDSLGAFRFLNITFENHTLTIKDKTGFVMDVFQIEFTKGDTFEWREERGTIYITVPPNTRGFDIQIMVKDIDPTVVESISIIVDNPDTGGTADYTWLWIALALLLLAAGAVIVKKSYNR